MIYKIGMLCKHFKGENLLEKNIYRIEKLEVDGKDIDSSIITYTGDGVLLESQNLVVYSNIFQDNKLFTREYEDISGKLSKEKQEMFNQELKVQPLTDEEIETINDEDFIEQKKKLVLSKFKKYAACWLRKTKKYFFKFI